MDKKIFAFFTFIFIIYLGFVSAELNLTSDSLDVYASIYATQEWAQVELNVSEIDFGWINVSEPFVAQKRRSIAYELRNRGNMNITVKPKLEDSTDLLFNNLYFSKKTSDSVGTWKQIGIYNISLNATIDNSWITNSLAIHLKLDNYLSESGGVIPFDITNHKNTVIFEVTPNYN